MFKYELSAFQWSLSKSDESHAKCDKKGVLRTEYVRTTLIPPPPLPLPLYDIITVLLTCCIVNGMAVVQRTMYSGTNTLGLFIDVHTASVLRMFKIHGSTRVYMVFDQNGDDKGTIKPGERDRLGCGRGVGYIIVNEPT